MYSFGLALQSNLDKVLSCNLFFSGFYAFDLITICPARTTALVPTKAKLSIVLEHHNESETRTKSKGEGTVLLVTRSIPPG